MRRPNVVLVFMDDMTHWALRSGEVSTPNLDRLRAQGFTFTQACNQGSWDAAVCMPARRMLLSGLTLFHAAERFMGVPHLGRTLTEAGYDTYFTGKWHNETEALEGDYLRVGPWAGGMLPSTEVGGAAYFRPAPGNAWDPACQSSGGHWIRSDDGEVQHSSERWTDAAVEFIQGDHLDHSYFLHLAYHAPHDPRQAPAEFLQLYEESKVRMPPNFAAVHPFDTGELQIRDELLAPSPRTEAAVRLHRREYFAILSHADREIGRVLDAVERADDGRGTVVVFSGDHGLALGEHGLFGKQNLYEHSIRVPLVIAGPGVPEGFECELPVYSGSIYPTVCDLVGLAVPEHIEFSSLGPALRGQPWVEEPLFFAYKDTQRAVRLTDHKLIEYADAVNNQLFELRDDPWELRNRYRDPELAELRAELTARLRELQQSMDDPLAASETHADDAAGRSTGTSAV